MSYSQQQIDQLTEALNTFGAEEVPRGLIQDFGEKSVMMQVTKHMIEHGNIPPTPEGIRLTVQAFEKAGHKIYYSKHEWDYIQEFQKLSPEAQNTFNTFWNSPWITGQLVTGSSQPGYENATKFLVWMRGREMNKGYLEMAFSNLAAKGQLKFVTKSYKYSETAQKAGEHKPGQFWTDSQKQEKEWQRQEAQRRADAERTRDNPAAAADAEWQRKWERLQGNSYAQTSRAKAILILKPDGKEDYKAMYNAALAMLDESGRQPIS